MIAQHRDHPHPRAKACKGRDARRGAVDGAALVIADIISAQEHKVRFQAIHLSHDPGHSFGAVVRSRKMGIGEQDNGHRLTRRILGKGQRDFHPPHDRHRPSIAEKPKTGG